MWDTIGYAGLIPRLHVRRKTVWELDYTCSSPIREFQNKLLVTSLSYKAYGGLVLAQVELCVVM